jgi:hypothetical protein
MNKHLGKYILPLMLLGSSTLIHAETETIISRITKITDDYILIDGDDGKATSPAAPTLSSKGKLNIPPPSKNDKQTYHGPIQFELVTETNQHLSPYPLTEFWIDQQKSDHNTFKGIGYTHPAEITIEDGTVRKIRTLDDYIL